MAKAKEKFEALALEKRQHAKWIEETFVSDDFLLITPLGKGGCGVVFKAMHVPTGHFVALKAAPLKNDGFKEKENYSELPLDTGVVPCYGAFTASLDDYFLGDYRLCTCLVLKLCEQGSLMQRLHTHGPLGEKEAAKIFHKLVDTVNGLHGQGIAHYDIKLENILIDDDDSPLLCDLGVSINGIWGVKSGTYGYMAPEQLAEIKNYTKPGNVCDEKADIFSLGVCLYEMLFGCRPFHGQKEITTLEKMSTPQTNIARIATEFEKLQVHTSEDEEKVRAAQTVRSEHMARLEELHEILYTPDTASDDLIDLLLKLLTDKDHRIRLAFVKRHPWIKRQLSGGSNPN